MTNVDPRLLAVHARMREATSSPVEATVQLYAWLRFQLGWSDLFGNDVSERSGKGIRPRLALLACEAVGGEASLAVPVASAIELTHEFSLIHDDIEDGDETRRGRPSLWTVCGTAQAINAGDVLFGIARSEIADSPVTDSVKADLYRRYDNACVKLAEGQFLDISFESKDRVSVDAYVGMVRRKTGALLAAAASMGAAAGGADANRADALGRFGEALGVGFQIRDDVLGLWGDPAVTGKPVGADLIRKKKSLPVMLAWEDRQLAAEVDELYASEAPDPTQAARLADAMDRGGCRKRAVETALAWGDKAVQALDEMPLERDARAELDVLVRRAVDRQK